MSITGCGCDIVKIERFVGVSQRFKEKYFTVKELEYIDNKPKEKQVETIAGLFAVKEAVLKAIGIGGGNGLSILEIEISHTKNGQPTAKINHELYRDIVLNVSISHTDTDALAFVVI